MKRLLIPAVLALTSLANGQQPAEHKTLGDRVSGFTDVKLTNRTLFGTGFQLGEQSLVGELTFGTSVDIGKGYAVNGGAWNNISAAEGHRETDIWASLSKTIGQGTFAGATIEGGFKRWDYFFTAPGNDKPYNTNNLGFITVSYDSIFKTRTTIDYHLLHMEDAKDGHQLSMTVDRKFILGTTTTGHELSVTPEFQCVGAKNFFGMSGFPIKCSIAGTGNWHKGKIDLYITAGQHAVLIDGRKPGVAAIGARYTFP